MYRINKNVLIVAYTLFMALTAKSNALSQNLIQTKYYQSERTNRPAYLRSLSHSTEKVLVILIRFPDTDLNTFAKTSQADWERTFFGSKPSVRDYYSTVSYDRLILHPAEDSSNTENNGIAGWYVLSNTLAWYKEKYNDWYVYLAQDAINASDTDVNYAQFNANTDDYISSHELHIHIIAAAYEASYYDHGSPEEPTVPRVHYSLINPYLNRDVRVKVDGVVIGDSEHDAGVSLSGELLYRYYDSSHAQTKVGYVAHELGHDFGLPDHYSRPDSAGSWCLMGSGDVIIPDPSFPHHLCAAHKAQLGWIQPTIIQADMSRNIAEIATSGECLKLWENGNPTTEYFLVENRNNQSSNNYDSSLPASGLLIWHVDSTKIKAGLLRDKDLGVTLEQADNEGYKGVGNAGDVFSSNSNANFLPVNSSPNSRSNKKNITGVAVANISAPGPTMSAEITVSHLPTQIGVTASPEEILSNWPSTSIITASLLDVWQETVKSATNLVTFTIISGSSSGQLVGTNPVDAINGIATVKLESTQSPGVVTIEASSPELPPATINVTVSEDVIWHVATNGDNLTGTGQPDKPFATIQKGIDQAASGDVVLVGPGTYFECICFNGKSIVVASHFLVTQDESYIANTIIDGSQALSDSSVVYFVYGEDEQTELVGFTIQNGRGSYVAYPDHHGGGISIHRGARPKIRYCHIRNNTSSYEGGGIFCRGAAPLLEFCVISGDSARRGGGIIFIDSSPRIENCTIVDNKAAGKGAGIFNHNSNPTFVNCIIWGNIAPSESQIANQRNSQPSISYSDVEGGWFGDGNIKEDPLFCNVENNDYRLTLNSPCVGAGLHRANMGAQQAGCESEPTTVSEPTNLNSLPESFVLYQNYPNPFNPLTTISFQHQKQAEVTLKIYNLRGQEVRTLVEEEKPAGYYSIQWDGLDKQGMKVSSGVYIYQINAGDFIASRKLILIR